MYVLTHVYLYAYTSKLVHTLLPVYTYVYLHLCTHIHTRVPIYIHTHWNICVYISVNRSHTRSHTPSHTDIPVHWSTIIIQQNVFRFHMTVFSFGCPVKKGEGVDTCWLTAICGTFLLGLRFSPPKKQKFSQFVHTHTRTHASMHTHGHRHTHTHRHFCQYLTHICTHVFFDREKERREPERERLCLLVFVRVCMFVCVCMRVHIRQCVLVSVWENLCLCERVIL